MPIDAADVFPPADHLADEALSRLERHSAFPPRPLRTGDHVAWVEEFHVQRLREPRVVEPGLTGPDRVLITAKERQAVRQKIVEGGAGLGRRDRPVELGQAARMEGEPGVHQVHDAVGDGIGREAHRCGKHARPSLRKRSAVFGVEVPLAAGGLAVVHEHTELLPERPIEVFEPQLLSSRGVLGKILPR